MTLVNNYHFFNMNCAGFNKLYSLVSETQKLKKHNLKMQRTADGFFYLSLFNRLHKHKYTTTIKHLELQPQLSKNK